MARLSTQAPIERWKAVLGGFAVDGANDGRDLVAFAWPERVAGAFYIEAPAVGAEVLDMPGH